MPTALPARQSLSQHAQAIRATHMRDWFAAPDAEQRVHAFTVEAAGLTLDYAKNRIPPETLALPLQLADEAGVLALRDAMLRGERINNTVEKLMVGSLGPVIYDKLVGRRRRGGDESEG